MLEANQNVNLFPSINGYFSDERRSPQVSALDVLKYASRENLCAALLIEKIPHLCIGNYLVLKLYLCMVTNLILDTGYSLRVADY